MKTLVKQSFCKVCRSKGSVSVFVQGTTVIPLLASVLLDEKEWKEPHNFNPTHFLDKEGKFIKRDAFLPFSAGWSISVPWLSVETHSFCRRCDFFRRLMFLCLVVFCLGRRACPGESLARMELFLFLSNLMQQFCFLPPKGVSVQQLSLTHSQSPLNQKLRAIVRS